MNDALTILFATIGFVVTFYGIATTIIWAIERSSVAKRERDERHRELLRKLDDIQSQMKSKKEAM